MPDPAETAAYVPALVDPDQCVGAVRYSQDGTALGQVRTAALVDRSVDAGARFRSDTAVVGLDVEGGRVRARERIAADDIALACGVWGRSAAASAGAWTCR